jgi:hypothetical protein
VLRGYGQQQADGQNDETKGRKIRQARHRGRIGNLSWKTPCRWKPNSTCAPSICIRNSSNEI